MHSARYFRWRIRREESQNLPNACYSERGTIFLVFAEIEAVNDYRLTCCQVQIFVLSYQGK